MTKKKGLLIVFTLLFIALIVLMGLKPLYYVYRELEYRWSEPTAAQQRVHDYAEEMGVSYGRYPKDLIALLEGNPEAEDFVLNYLFRKDMPIDLSGYESDAVPLFLQFDPMWGYEDYGSSYLAVTGCGPTCLAMAGYYLTGDADMNPKAVAAFAEKNGYYAPGYGSSWKLISQGAAELGLTAKELPLVQAKMVRALEEDKTPIILAMGEGDFTTTGHYIVLTGMEDGAFRVNDPNSRRNSEKLWTYEQLEGQIRNIWAIGLPQ